jgi:biotin carboxyl carrier protein
MHYVVDLDNNREFAIDLQEADRGVWEADIGDEEPVRLKLKGRADDGGFVIAVNGVERTFYLDSDATSAYLTDDRDMMKVQVDPAGDVVLDHGTTERRGELDLGTLRSPITGVAIEILVSEGDTVEEGQPVMIVEAMKMENTLTAPVTGKVTAVEPEQGDRVHSDDVLLRIDRNQ